MWQRSGDLTGSWKALAAPWHGLLVCTHSPCQQRSIHKEVFGGVVSEAIVASPSSAQCQASGISEYGCEIFNYILPVSSSRHPRHYDQSNLTALLGARAVPMASFYRWKNQVAELLRYPPILTRKVCQQPGTGSPNVHPRPPARDTTSRGGSAYPHRHAGCRGSSALQQGRHVSPHRGALLGCGKGSPSAGAGGKTPSGDRRFFGRAVPRQCSRWSWLPHTRTGTAPKDHVRPRVATVPPCRGLIPAWPGFQAPALAKFPAPLRLFRLLFSTGLQANGPGELQRSWKKANACLTKAWRVDRRQERWAFPLAPESTQSCPALASLDDLQLLLVL